MSGLLDVAGAPFSLILADPPWRFEPYDRATGLEKSPDAHYETMSLAQMVGLPVAQIADKNALLAMWVYDPMLPDAFRIAQFWGFPEYVTVLFRWLKTTDGQYHLFEPGAERLNFGTGYHTRHGGCEECWLFRRGDGLKVLNHGIRTEFFSPVREHSRKPSKVNRWLVDLYGDVPRIELFARTGALGWSSWGLEVGKFNP